MPNSDVEWIGIQELKEAVKRNPIQVRKSAKAFLQKGLAKYRSGIQNNPWRLGTGGGGAPVAAIHGGNLRDSHNTKIDGLMGSIAPNTQRAKYAKYVHDGTWKMEGRPWLDYVKSDKDEDIVTLYRDMLKEITKDLAS